MTKIILITGATSGFGKASAELFRSNGWKLILTGRRKDRLLELQAKLGKENVHIAAFDVRDRQQVEAMVKDIPPDFRSIDILLNNAGLALGLGPAHETDLDEWEEYGGYQHQGAAVYDQAHIADDGCTRQRPCH